jgi:hypothetical protein
MNPNTASDKLHFGIDIIGVAKRLFETPRQNCNQMILSKAILTHAPEKLRKCFLS